MKIIDRPFETIDRLMSENKQVLFNLFYLIADNDGAFWATDESSYIIGQSGEKAPMWAWIKDDAPKSALCEVESVIAERLALNPELSVTGDAGKLTFILGNICEKTGAKCRVHTPMTVYRCDKVIPKVPSGRMILSDDSHKEIMARFLAGMIYDIDHSIAPDEETEGFARDVAGSPDFFLWQDGDAVVSMAMITHRTDKYARINTVYTDAVHRCKGYAGMLVGEVTQKVLDEGRIPMLYTELDNPSSNAAYKRIGYKLIGEMTKFVFCS